MINNPLVSVWMITYNHEKFIAKAIDSVLMQKTNFEFEIVIGEDCSADKTCEIILDYNAKFPGRFKLLLHPNNVGAMKNQIFTLQACTGKYIALLEGDDYWADFYKLQKQVDFLEAHQEYSMVFTARNVVDKEGNFIGIERYPDKKYSTKDVVENFIPSTQTIVMRNYKDITKFMQQNSNHPSGDRLITYYCSLLGDIYYLNETTACYRESGEGVWSSFDLHQKRKISFDRFKEFHQIIGIENNNLVIVNRAVTLFYLQVKDNIKRPLFITKNLFNWYKIYFREIPLCLLMYVMLSLIWKRMTKILKK